MSYVLNAVSTADDYPLPGEAAAMVPLIVTNDEIQRLVLTVEGATIIYQLAKGIHGWSEEKRLVPAIYTLERLCNGIRMRSATAGKPATVTIEAATKADIPI